FLSGITQSFQRHWINRENIIPKILHRLTFEFLDEPASLNPSVRLLRKIQSSLSIHFFHSLKRNCPPIFGRLEALIHILEIWPRIWTRQIVEPIHAPI